MQLIHTKEDCLKTGRITLLLLMFLSHFMAVGESDCGSKFATLQKFSNAAQETLALNYFYGQEDELLWEERNGKPPYALIDGGLCAPATAHVLLTILEKMQGVAPRNQSIDEIIRMTDHASALTGEDARYGLYTGQMQDLLLAEGELRGLKGVSYLPVSIYSGEGVSSLSWLGVNTFKRVSNSSIYAVASKIYEFKNGKKNFLWDHFFVAYDFDPKALTLKVIDPLEPKFVINARLIPVRDIESPSLRTFEIIYDRAVKGSPVAPIMTLTAVIGVNFN
jgi:hypothetical protein